MQMWEEQACWWYSKYSHFEGRTEAEWRRVFVPITLVYISDISSRAGLDLIPEQDPAVFLLHEKKNMAQVFAVVKTTLSDNAD